MNNGYVIYARKSSETEDRQAASIDDQLKVLRELALERGLVVLKEFVEAKSAKSRGRPVFNEMTNYIEKTPLQGIICWHLNRLSRNPYDDGLVRYLLQDQTIKEIVTPSKVIPKTIMTF
jgi:site-specific DNA recombinase